MANSNRRSFIKRFLIFISSWSWLKLDRARGQFPGAFWQVPGYTLWTWGSNASGLLGLGDLDPRSSPVQIGSPAEWLSVRLLGSHMLGIKKNGSLWGWGGNLDGQLGINNITSQSSPIQIGGNWKSIGGSSNFSLGIYSNGTLWSWGLNNYGQLGLNDSTPNRSSPMQIGTEFDWGKLGSSSGSSAHAMAIKSNGTLWAWGYNSTGQLGIGNMTNKSVPVQVGVSSWTAVSQGLNFSLAVRTDGSLWSWGNNTLGQLGLNDRTSRSLPVQIGTSSFNWSFVSCGNDHVLALKSDRTLWAWGNNTSGAMGVGDTMNRSSPVQVGILSDWSGISAGSGTSMALRSNGTLWAWGNNSAGQLGLNSVMGTSSPVQVGLLSTWKKISIAMSSTAGLR